MHILFAIAIGASYLAAYILGLCVARRRATVLHTTFWTCFALIALRTLFYLLPGTEYPLSRYYWYCLVQPWWPPLVAFVLLGIGTLRMGRLWRRILVAACAWALLAVMVQGLTARVMFEPSNCAGRPDNAGLCRQTTAFTCGAAAAATLMYSYGVETDERTMALACWTNHFNGTSAFPICKALHTKLKGTGKRPRLITADWDALEQHGGPAMTTIGLHESLDHWVVIRGVHEDSVGLADPNGGLWRMSRAAFLARWKRFLLIVEPAGQTHPLDSS